MYHPHKSEGRKPLPYRPFRFTVQGFDRGIPFLVYHRTLSGAITDLEAADASITDLRSGKTLKYIMGKWIIIASSSPDFSIPLLTLKE